MFSDNKKVIGRQDESFVKRVWNKFKNSFLEKTIHEDSNNTNSKTKNYDSISGSFNPPLSIEQKVKPKAKVVFYGKYTNSSKEKTLDELKKIRKSLGHIKILLTIILLALLYPYFFNLINFIQEKTLNFFAINEIPSIKLNDSQLNNISKKKILAGTLYEGTTQKGKIFEAVQIDITKIDLYLNDDVEKPLVNFDGLRDWLNKKNRRLLFAMNAGIYGQDNLPLGLHVENGKLIRSLNLYKEEKINADNSVTGNFFMLPNGVFLLNKQGASVVESNSLKDKNSWEDTKLAAQSGPLLLLNGQIHPSFKQNSENEKIRNGVGVLDEKTVVFIISKDPITFYEFATIFRDTFNCKNALYLDGAISNMYIFENGIKNYTKDKFAGMIGVSIPADENIN